MLTFWKLNFLDGKKAQKTNGLVFHLAFDLEILSHKILEHLATRLCYFI